MTRVRFNTDQALFETFPGARDHVPTAPRGVPPLHFLNELMRANKVEEALSFCAYLLPRREAVAWGCRCLRAMRGEGASAPGTPALAAAEAWVEAPEEDLRRTAHDHWRRDDRGDPATWLAAAAAWTGGNMVPDRKTAVQAPAHLTAATVRTALLLALHKTPKAERPACARGWIAAGTEIAERGV